MLKHLCSKWEFLDKLMNILEELRDIIIFKKIVFCAITATLMINYGACFYPSFSYFISGIML